VEHTGTQFFEKHVLRSGFKNPHTAEPHEIAFAHCIPERAADIDANERSIVTTIRDPLATAASWYSRRKSLERFELAWELWATKVYPNAAAVLSVDHDREARLERARAVLPELSSVNWHDRENTSDFNSMIHEKLAQRDADYVFSKIDRGMIERVMRLADFPSSYGWWL
jgi:hypothetical protein